MVIVYVVKGGFVYGKIFVVVKRDYFLLVVVCVKYVCGYIDVVDLCLWCNCWVDKEVKKYMCE